MSTFNKHLSYLIDTFDLALNTIIDILVETAYGHSLEVMSIVLPYVK